MTSIRNDDASQIDAYRRVLEVASSHADAHFALGMLLLRTHRENDGVDELKKAVEASDGGKAEAYGKQVTQILARLGREVDRQEVEGIVRRKLAPRQ